MTEQPVAFKEEEYVNEVKFHLAQAEKADDALRNQPRVPSARAAKALAAAVDGLLILRRKHYHAAAEACRVVLGPDESGRTKGWRLRGASWAWFRAQLQLCTDRLKEEPPAPANSPVTPRPERRLWIEDDATPGTEGHETLAAAWQRLFNEPYDPKAAVKTEDWGDGTRYYFAHGRSAYASYPGNNAIFVLEE
jgi:hypothetical protein